MRKLYNEAQRRHRGQSGNYRQSQEQVCQGTRNQPTRGPRGQQSSESSGKKTERIQARRGFGPEDPPPAMYRVARPGRQFLSSGWFSPTWLGNFVG
jgi:hypothetical protein